MNGPDPKPPVVRRPRGGRTLRSQVHDPDAMKEAVLRDRECRVCGGPAATAHHIVPKGGPHYGDDVLANLGPVCGSGTTECHGLLETHDVGACVAFGLALRPENIAYVLDRLGPDAGLAFLERRYLVRLDDDDVWRPAPAAAPPIPPAAIGTDTLRVELTRFNRMERAE